jgi:hypothetical protein
VDQSAFCPALPAEALSTLLLLSLWPPTAECLVASRLVWRLSRHHH